MTRTEFDQQVRELRNKKNEALKPIIEMQNEIKLDLLENKRRMTELHQKSQKLNQARLAIGQRRFNVERSFDQRISEFIKANEPSTTSNLAEASTLNIVYELRRRGFGGKIQRAEPETGNEEAYDLDKRFTDDDGGIFHSPTDVPQEVLNKEAVEV